MPVYSPIPLIKDTPIRKSRYRIIAQYEDQTDISLYPESIKNGKGFE